jgi:hypothetical protein
MQELVGWTLKGGKEAVFAAAEAVATGFGSVA